MSFNKKLRLKEIEIKLREKEEKLIHELSKLVIITMGGLCILVAIIYK